MDYEIYKQMVKQDICGQLTSLLPFFIAICAMAYWIFLVPNIVARFKIMVLKNYVFADLKKYEKRLEVFEAMTKRDKHYMILFRRPTLKDFFTEEEIQILKS